MPFRDYQTSTDAGYSPDTVLPDRRTALDHDSCYTCRRRLNPGEPYAQLAHMSLCAKCYNTTIAEHMPKQPDQARTYLTTSPQGRRRLQSLTIEEKTALQRLGWTVRAVL